MDVVIKYLLLGATYVGLLITIIKIGVSAVRRHTELGLKITEMEKDILEMDEKHAKDILRIELSIESIKRSNAIEHGRLFNKLEEVGKGVAGINGYLKGIKE